jgi:hypothetical protein
MYFREGIMGKAKWIPKNLVIKKKSVSDERAQQLLAEVGEILYKRLCRQVQVENKSTEPVLQELGNNQLKKAVSS